MIACLLNKMVSLWLGGPILWSCIAQKDVSSDIGYKISKLTEICLNDCTLDLHSLEIRSQTDIILFDFLIEVWPEGPKSELLIIANLRIIVPIDLAE